MWNRNGFAFVRNWNRITRMSLNFILFLLSDNWKRGMQCHPIPLYSENQTGTRRILVRFDTRSFTSTVNQSIYGRNFGSILQEILLKNHLLNSGGFSSFLFPSIYIYSRSVILNRSRSRVQLYPHMLLSIFAPFHSIFFAMWFCVKSLNSFILVNQLRKTGMTSEKAPLLMF